MNIRVLGAHCSESKDSRCACLVIDNILALDAGALTSNLSLKEQQQLKAILISHKHYDHIRDIPSITINQFYQNSNARIYATETVFNAIAANMFNAELYPKFFEIPELNPAAEFIVIEPEKPFKIDDYDILAVPVNHEEGSVGYQITSADGKKIFYSGDTGSGLANCWKIISPQLLFIEVTLPNRWQKSAKKWGHLTPSLLGNELVSFNEIKGYLPKVIVVHMNPVFQKEIEIEMKTIAGNLGCPIDLAFEGMEVIL
jgi:ribonuclease BN (tRNA processing enzyme)